MSDTDSRSPKGVVAPGAERPVSAFSRNQKVILLHAEGTRQTYRLHKERIVLGSVESADVRLGGTGVAPIHAVIELNHDEKTDSYVPAIYDLASDTGVFVNSKKVVTGPLKEGDLITVGRHTLSFRLEDVLRAAAPTQKVEEAEGRKLFLNPDEDLKPLLLQDDIQVQQIFDYRPTSKTALEVVMSWMGMILTVEHFVDQKKVTIGETRDCDFGIPAGLTTKKFPVVTLTPGGYILHIDPKMKGVVQSHGELKQLDELRGIPDQFGQAVGIAKDDFAKISVGDVDFYLSFTVAPPRLKPSKMLERDPLMIKFFMMSLLLTGLTVTGLLNARVPQTIDAEQIPDRLAAIIYEPQKYLYQPPVDHSKVADVSEPQEKHEPKPKQTQTKVKLDIHPHENPPKKVPKYMNVGEQKVVHRGSRSSHHAHGGLHSQGQGKEGEGARAKGKEGKRGSHASHAHGTAQSAALRPSPTGGKGRGGGHSQVADNGNVDVLKGATSQIEDILGDSAAALGKSGEKLRGFGGFSTAGNGGLALEGTGHGGGGNANTTLGGLSNKGRGGGRVGTGLGAAGNGRGIIGGESRVAIRSGGPEEAVVMGSIDADAVEAALLAHKDEFRFCYEKEINAENPTLAGRVGTSFVIGSSGRVEQAGIESTTLHNTNAERCILAVIRRIDFPIPNGAGTVQVTYPFKFTPVGH